MPHKGLHTQVLVVLLRRPVSLQTIELQLKDFKIAGRAEIAPKWLMGGPSCAVAPRLSVAVPYRPDVNGYAWIDVVSGSWPDKMGHAEVDPEVFAAWGMGYFGPGAWPGCLERACQHSLQWPDGRFLPLQHRAFLRIRCSYLFGADGEAPVMPKDYEPFQELKFVTRIAVALVRLPEVLCLFNPSGECVRDAGGFLDSLSYHESVSLPPLDVWSNVRFFRFTDMKPEWSLMDTVGMIQLDAPDHEAWFESGAYAPGEVGNFLRNASAYVMKHGPVINDGDTMNGPGNANWQAFGVKEGRVVPPRPVVRWFPLDQRKAPAELTASITNRAIRH